MRLGVLAVLAAAPVFLVACSGDDPSDGDNPFFPSSETSTESDVPDGGDSEGFVVTVFDEAALEGPDGVRSILVDEYMLENIEEVDCPPDQEVEVGRKFECTVGVGGEEPKEMTVQITVTSDDGQYQVGLPE